MLKHFHELLHRWLDTRTKKALALTLGYAVAWLGVYGVYPAPDSLAVLVAGSREAAKQAGEVLMESLFWCTVLIVALLAVWPPRQRTVRIRTRRP